MQVLPLLCLNGFHETPTRSPLNAAILAHDYFEGRRLPMVVGSESERLLITKGAP